MDFFILDGHTPVSVSAEKWATWWEHADGDRRRVKWTTLGDVVDVSTVFIGLNYRVGHGPPVLFETMVFGPTPEDAALQHRYTTWDEAVAGHDEVVAMLRARHYALPPHTEDEED